MSTPFDLSLADRPLAPSTQRRHGAAIARVRAMLHETLGEEMRDLLVERDLYRDRLSLVSGLAALAPSATTPPLPPATPSDRPVDVQAWHAERQRWQAAYAQWCREAMTWHEQQAGWWRQQAAEAQGEEDAP